MIVIRVFCQYCKKSLEKNEEKEKGFHSNCKNEIVQFGENNLILNLQKIDFSDYQNYVDSYDCSYLGLRQHGKALVSITILSDYLKSKGLNMNVIDSILKNQIQIANLQFLKYL